MSEKIIKVISHNFSKSFRYCDLSEAIEFATNVALLHKCVVKLIVLEQNALSSVCYIDGEGDSRDLYKIEKNGFAFYIADKNKVFNRFKRECDATKSLCSSNSKFKLSYLSEYRLVYTESNEKNVLELSPYRDNKRDAFIVI